MKNKIFYLIIVLLFSIQNITAQTVEIDSVTKPPGEIYVQVDMLNFSDVGAITLYIEFDSDLMSFVKIDSTQLAGTWDADFNNDKLKIAYFGDGYPIDGKLLDIVFDYKGGFSTDVTFDTANCEIVDSDLDEVNSDYENGFVEQTTADGTVTIVDTTEIIGDTVKMPVTIEGTGNFAYVDAITLRVSYDDNELDYTGIDEMAITGVTANAADGVLKMDWTGGSKDFTTLDTLLLIVFVYNGDTADLEFIPGCEIASGLTLLATDYVHGAISPEDQGAKLTIESVGDTAGAQVNVPVVAENITVGSQKAGAISLSISFGDSLTYTGYTANQLSGWVVNCTDNTISIEWTSSGDGDTISDGDLITLDFNYKGTPAEIEFDPGCEIKTNHLTRIPVSFIDGWVSDLVVSGTLDYVSGDTIPNSTVYLKSADDSSTVASAGTNADGDFEITGVAPGDYFLDASTTTDATTSYDQTDAFVIYLSGSGLTGLYFLAGDVNEDGFADQTDAFIVYLSWAAGNVKGPSWSAPDWIFENPSFTVSTSNVTQNLSGICSGDANGDFVPVP